MVWSLNGGGGGGGGGGGVNYLTFLKTENALRKNFPLLKTFKIFV